MICPRQSHDAPVIVLNISNLPARNRLAVFSPDRCQSCNGRGGFSAFDPVARRDVRFTCKACGGSGMECVDEEQAVAVQEHGEEM
jgi:DnaJ-class molecular chaperone